MAAARFIRFLAHHELTHFELEESLLLPELSEAEDDRQLAERVLADHEFFRETLRELREGIGVSDVTYLHGIGDRLRAHIRMEERELFPRLEESLDQSALEHISVQLAGRPS